MFSVSPSRSSRAPASLKPTRPALVCVLLCRLPRRFSQQRKLDAGPPKMHSGFDWERGRLLFGCPRNDGRRKRRTYMYMNQLTIIGFIGNDAEAHYTSGGKLVTTLSVATKESWKDTDGQWQSRTEWHRVATFGKLAEYARTL